MRPEDRPLGPSGFNPRGDHFDQLDALLTARYAGRPAAARAGMAPADLAPLLAAADTLTPLAEALPTAEFAAQLEARLLARVESQAPTIPMTAFPPATSSRRATSVAPRRRAAPPPSQPVYLGGGRRVCSAGHDGGRANRQRASRRAILSPAQSRRGHQLGPHWKLSGHRAG